MTPEERVAKLAQRVEDYVTGSPTLTYKGIDGMIVEAMKEHTKDLEGQNGELLGICRKLLKVCSNCGGSGKFNVLGEDYKCGVCTSLRADIANIEKHDTSSQRKDGVTDMWMPGDQIRALEAEVAQLKESKEMLRADLEEANSMLSKNEGRVKEIVDDSLIRQRDRALLQMRELKRIFVKDSCDCGPWQDEELQRHKAGCQYRMYVEDIEKQHPISEGVVIRQGEDGAECAKCGEKDYPLVNHKCKAQCPKCGIVGKEDRCLSCNADMERDTNDSKKSDEIEEFAQGVREHSSSTPCMDCGRPVLPGRTCGAC